MGEKRSNHTVYNVNYHFVWCRQSEIDCLQIKICNVRSTATRFSNQSRIRWSRVSVMCATSTATRYCHGSKDRRSFVITRIFDSRTTPHLARPRTPVSVSPSEIRTERNRADGREHHGTGKCGNSTNRSWRSICGVAGFGRNRTTSGRQETFRRTRSGSILSERNTFNGAYGLHPRGQAPRHSACSAWQTRRTALAPVLARSVGLVADPLFHSRYPGRYKFRPETERNRS